MTVNPGPGAPYGPVGDTRAQLRVTTVDRDRALEMLQRAYGEGRLTKDEFDSRSGRALEAVTFTDLDSLVGDLTVVTPPPTWGPTYGGPAQRTNALAISALCCGIGQLLLGILAGVPAIILGHIARRQIRQTGEQGAGMALAGIILGWIGVALTVLFVVLFALLFAAAYHAAHVPTSPVPGG